MRLHGRTTRFTYHCSICDQKCFNTVGELSRSEPILDESGNPTYDNKGKPAMRTISGRGLGTWHCPDRAHEPTKVVRRKVANIL